MNKDTSLQRFADAQASGYADALLEIRKGKKTGHWMWYIFPQLAGLGISGMARYYAIQDLAEAKAYLQHPVLGLRLSEISNALLHTGKSDAYAIFGTPDDLKLRSCMTLFSAASPTATIFQQVLDRFFNGRPDEKTLRLLQKQS